MKQLPPGITGFYRLHHDPPPPSVDEQAWKRACYYVARQTGGTVIRYESSADQVAPNYHAVTLRYPNHTVAVLCNAHYPVLAFTDQGEARFARIHFITMARLARCFTTETSFTPLDVDYLCAYPAPALLDTLNVVEREQIRVWRPEQVGDIIFHHWD
ncbi:MAG TPA: hypothetical protein VGD69_32785 [Herpetosiphonaceae bacterium]